MQKNRFTTPSFYSALFACYAVATTATTWAAPDYVDLRDVNLVGTVTEIGAPNVLKVQTRQQGERRHVWVELVNVDFGDVRYQTCPSRLSLGQTTPRQARVKAACKRMRRWLQNETVGIEVVEWTQPVLKGYVMLDHAIVNNELIARGCHPVDYRQTRSAPAALLEKKARDRQVGIWRRSRPRGTDTNCAD